MFDESTRKRKGTVYEVSVVALADKSLPIRILDMCAALNVLPEHYAMKCNNRQSLEVTLSISSLNEQHVSRLIKRIYALPAVQHVKHVSRLAESQITFPAKTLLTQDNKMTGADLVLATLADLGVDTVFGYPGGAVLPLYDALHRQNKISHILVRHEQAAVHAAEGYARSTGKVGVCFATSGPGATNTITGLTDALMDSVPVLCITGQVASSFLGTDAFQEANVVSLMRPATKYNSLVTRAECLQSSVTASFDIARSGRPGPVALDIPKDIQAQSAVGQLNRTLSHAIATQTSVLPRLDEEQIQRAVELLKHAKKPVIYVGGGVINSGPGASRALRTFASELGAPVTSTLMGLGAYPANDPLFVGMLGMHGAYEANRALHECDVMLNIGARFDDRVTGQLDGFAPNAKKIHIDIDKSEIGKLVAVDVGIVADAEQALIALSSVWDCNTDKRASLDTWWETIRKYQGRKCFNYTPGESLLKPQEAIERLWNAVEKLHPIVSTEVGQHQMWSAQFCRFDKPGHWLTSGGLGTMGYGLPAAIGAQVAHHDELVIDIAGEASIQMNIQELATLKQYDLPVKVFVINNKRMGMVRQWQDMHFEGRRSQSYAEALPDFVKVAESYGILGLRVSFPGELENVLKKMLAYDGPVVVECMVEEDEDCYPMIPSGANHNEMVLQRAND